jgi:translation initiation factor 2B subunit (eIF-2B alpha/beta/delta family)
MEPNDGVSILISGNRSEGELMKTAKLLGVVEHQAARLLKAARRRYNDLTRSAAKMTDVRHQRRYLRAAKQTIASAEKIIAQLKQRVAVAEKSLAAGKKRGKQRVKRKTKRRVKRVVTRARRKKRG